MSINARTVKFAILADIHVVPGNVNDSILHSVVAEINASDADVVVVNGDLSNEGSDRELANVKRTLDELTKPVYVLPGNHEDTWSQSACKTFNDIWGQDRFVFEIDDLVVAGVNCGPYMKMGDGHIKQEDLLWLDKTLSERITEGKRFISFCHYPLSSDLDNYEDYLAVIEKYPTITHVNGHYHTWKRYKANYKVDCTMTRALYMKDHTFGYAEMHVTADSIKFFEKVLEQPLKLKYAYAIDNYLKKGYQQAPLPANAKVSLVFRDDASIFTRVGIDDKRIYIGNSLGYVKAVNKADGKVVWQYKTDASIFSRPAVTEKYVIVPTADKRLLWLDKDSGALVKEHNSEAPYMADGIIADGVLYQGGGKSFEAWCADGSKQLWKYTDIKNYCQAAPVVDGKEKWRWNNGKNNNMLGPGNCVPVVCPDKVIIVAPDRYMTAIDRKTGKTIWRNNSHKFRESLGVSQDGKTAYAKTMDGELVAVSTEGSNYRELWMVDAGLGYEHAPCIVLEHNGVVYMGSRRGIMVAIDAKEHKKLWEYKMGSSEFNGWEIDENGDVYTSLIEGVVWKVHID